MTNVLVLCAGHATRFTDAGIHTPKPILPIGKDATPMVKVTTDSLPFIDELKPGKLAFAVLQEHVDDRGMGEVLKSLYNEPALVAFSHVTRGNLETAQQAAESMVDKKGWSLDEPLLILDSDNKYDGSGFVAFIEEVEKLTKEFGVICYFEPIDDKTHWCFAQMKGLEVFNLLEKHPSALDPGIDGKPMVGTFYFSSARLFLAAAKDVITEGEKSKNEFFMSQAITRLMDLGSSVYGCKVDTVIPLGTPEDVKNYEHRTIRIAIDLDDTINYCKKPTEKYGNEALQEGVIDTMRNWKKQGHYIIIHTARHMNTCHGNVGLALAREGLIMLQWLKDNDVPYDEIWWSKPHADIFIDDKGFRHTKGEWTETAEAVKRFIRGDTI